MCTISILKQVVLGASVSFSFYMKNELLGVKRVTQIIFLPCYLLFCFLSPSFEASVLIFVADEGWLLLNIGRFVLNFNIISKEIGMYNVRLHLCLIIHERHVNFQIR